MEPPRNFFFLDETMQQKMEVPVLVASFGRSAALLKQCLLQVWSLQRCDRCTPFGGSDPRL
jgi:hypothetical protein